MGKFAASKAVVKGSWAILKQDKEILWFPALSAIVSSIAFLIMGAFFFVSVLKGDINNFESAMQNASGTGYVLLLIYYLVLFFIVNFFQAGILTIAHARFNGQDLHFNDGLKGASRNVGRLFVWSLISATVGVILHLIADRSKLIGKIVASILGAAWSIMTYFSLPALVIGQTTITGSFKESASLIRKTWGEALIINVGVGLFFAALFVAGFAVWLAAIFLTQQALVFLVITILLIVYLIILSIISSALSVIFRLALYEYARTGQMPQGFSQELIKSAIK